MRKATLDQRASLPEQALAIGPVHPLPVSVDGPLLLLLAVPVPLPPLLLLRNICSYFRPLHLSNTGRRYGNPCPRPLLRCRSRALAVSGLALSPLPGQSTPLRSRPPAPGFPPSSWCPLGWLPAA